ncbi:MAG TPA: hypothetical protein VGN14_13855 [Candidatus Elarobacter sp.]|jgi:hypothetical protein
MNDDRTRNGDEAANNEPGLTERNTETIRGEEEIADEDTTVDESNIERLDDTSTRTKSGAIPSSYGASGGMTITDGEDG